MTEQSIHWDSTGTGDGALTGITETQLYQFNRSLFLRDQAAQCVLKNFLNSLAVSGTSSPVAVATGGAVVAGFLYLNDASLNVAVPTPTVSTRIDRIVLRVNWSAQTVRVARVAGVEGGGAPTLTQTLNTIYEVPLAQASITTGGAITLTDQRQYAKFNTEVDTSSLADSTVTFAKIQNIASDRLVGRDTASSGSAEELTVSGGLEFTGSGGIRRSALTGDVTASAGSNATTIADNAVTGAKIADQGINPATKLQGTGGIRIDPANGNSRGTGANDLQCSRSVAAQVASGTFSTIIGGQNNTASGTRSIAGGTNTQATAEDAVAFGNQNIASAAGAFAIGKQNTAAGGNSVAIGVLGKANNYGQFTQGNQGAGSLGTSQSSVLVAAKTTTNNTPTVLSLDGDNSSNLIVIANDTTWAFRVLIVARRLDADNESAGYIISGVIDNNSNTVALVGSIVKTVLAEDTAAWDATVEADNTGKTLSIKVTGENAKTIGWVARLEIAEITG